MLTSMPALLIILLAAGVVLLMVLNALTSRE